MKIVILDDPAKDIRPKNSVRADVAWKLFLPDAMGDIPTVGRSNLNKFTNWLWSEFADRLGFLRKDSPDIVYVLTPLLTAAAKEFILRISSMWSDEVHIVNGPEEDSELSKLGENHWIPPVSNVYSNGNSALSEIMTVNHDGASTTFLMPGLGSTKAFIRTYLIHKGGTYARLHSHSAVEEHYLVLEGSGSLRYGEHKVALRQGDLVSKPIGPDNFSQFLADGEDDLRIMDIEVWPDQTHRTKDVVLYPDHKEVLFRGEGWDSIVQSDSFLGSFDFDNNYDVGYERKPDGTWESKKIPGFKDRSK